MKRNSYNQSYPNISMEFELWQIPIILDITISMDLNPLTRKSNWTI